MKTIDIKSLLIGTLLTATIFLGVAATSPTDKWDANQQWETCSLASLTTLGHVKRDKELGTIRVVKGGWEPFASYGPGHIHFRRRIK
jgi:hypothetical protein